MVMISGDKRPRDASILLQQCSFEGGVNSPRNSGILVIITINFSLSLFLSILEIIYILYIIENMFITKINKTINIYRE